MSSDMQIHSITADFIVRMNYIIIILKIWLVTLIHFLPVLCVDFDCVSGLTASPALVLHSFVLAPSFRSLFSVKAWCSKLNELSSAWELAMGSRDQQWLCTSSTLLVMQHCQAKSSPKAALTAPNNGSEPLQDEMWYELLPPLTLCLLPSSVGEPFDMGRAAFKLQSLLQTKSRTPMSSCRLIPSSAGVSGPRLLIASHIPAPLFKVSSLFFTGAPVKN